MKRWFCIFIVIAALLPWSVVASDTLLLALDLETTEGERVEGAFSVQSRGAFLHTSSGGKLYRWEAIKPASLPILVRQAVRRQILGLARHAQSLYDTGHIEAAQSRYAYIHQLGAYLAEEDWDEPALANLDAKRQGWVKHEGEWLPYTRQQEKLGRILVNGEWMSKEKARVYRDFEQALAAARDADDAETGAMLLSRVIDKHPEAPYVAVAEQARQRLLASLEPKPQGFNGQLVQSERPPQQPEPRPRTSHFIYEESSGFYDHGYRSFGYYPGRIVISGDSKIIVPPTPRYHRRQYSSGGLSIRIGP